MKPERLFRALSDVGDDLIARAGAPAGKQRIPWGRWAGLAACCALVVGLAALALPQLGFGAKSAAPDTARSTGQDMTQMTTESEAPEAMAEWAVEAPEEAPMEEPQELPAEAPAAEPSPTEAPAPWPAETPAPQEDLEKNNAGGALAPAMEPSQTDNPPANAEGLLCDYEFTSATLQMSGADAPVTVTGEALAALLEQLRALPLGEADGEQAGAAPMTLRLYEQDRLRAVVTLPCFSVSAAGDAAQDGFVSEASQALYEQLVKDWFAK